MLKINPCQITVKDEKSFISLPERIPKVYSISYKFNKISDTEMVYVRRGQPKSLHAGFLSMNVLILDDKPDKYMNIDRDRLRKGAIDEEELLTVQREIMRRWCIDLCERCEIKQEKGKEGTEYFANIKGTLISLILLFYRNVPDDSFRRFINLYKKIVDSWKLFLETDELPVSELWDQENLFQTQVDLPEMVIKGMKKQEEQQNDAQKEPKILAISTENIQRLPHRIVRIESIMRKENKICYHLRLQSIRQKIESIDMSEEACLYDYIGAFDFYHDGSKKIKFDTLPKKVYKPDSRFENLLVHCFPRTFHKGRNMSGYLDYCIKTYILSPIDRDTAIILKDEMKEGKDMWTEFKDRVMGSEQMKKCVAYIMKKRFADCDDRIEKESAVRKDYERFLKQFYRILIENRELVMNQVEVK